MKISELVALLNDYQDKYGDLEVMCATDADLTFRECNFDKKTAVLAHDRRNDKNSQRYNVVLSSHEYATDKNPDNYYRVVGFVSPEYRAEMILGLWIDQDF